MKENTIETEVAAYLAELGKPLSPAPNTTHFIRMRLTSKWGHNAVDKEIQKQFSIFYPEQG